MKSAAKGTFTNNKRLDLYGRYWFLSARGVRTLSSFTVHLTELFSVLIILTLHEGTYLMQKTLTEPPLYVF